MSAQDESHKVVIVFSGIVALGPPLPEQPKDGRYVNDGPLRGVMPVSGRRKVKYRDAKNNPIEEYSRVHLPVVFSKATSSGRPVDDVYRGFNLWYPVRERLAVSIDGDSTPGKLVYQHDPEYGRQGKVGDPDGPLPKVPIEDIAAVPDMRLISPNRSVMRAGVLDEDAVDVSAQVSVPRGTLRAGAHDEAKFGTKLTYAPPVNGNALRAVVVPQVRVELAVQNLLIIESWSLDTGEELDAIEFEVTGDTEIWIANIDVEDVRAIIDKLVKPPQNEGEGDGGGGGTGEGDEGGDGGDAEGDVPTCDTDFVRYFELTDGAADVFVPCNDSNDFGDRKCYTLVTNLPIAKPKR